MWLPDRDSNPDSTVNSRVSYHWTIWNLVDRGRIELPTRCLQNSRSPAELPARYGAKAWARTTDAQLFRLALYH